MMEKILPIIRRKGIFEFFFQASFLVWGMFLSKLGVLVLRIRGYQLDPTVSLGGENSFSQSRKNSIFVGRNSELGRRVKLMAGFGGHITIGENVRIYENTIIDSHSRITIGDHTLIAPFVYITDYDHKIERGRKPLLQRGYVRENVEIGRNVWIGTKAIILKGVTIGRNSVIGAGAVVTRSVPPGCLAAGVPAKIIRKI